MVDVRTGFQMFLMPLSLKLLINSPIPMSYPEKLRQPVLKFETVY